MQLTNDFNLKEIENNVKDYLSKIDLKKIIANSQEKNERIMFIEGPPTMNGEPHAGHLRGRVFKDLWYRFSTLDGKNVVFNAGWDTQGLPVELQAEKEMGITNGKSEITTQEQIETLVAECKKLFLNITKSGSTLIRNLACHLTKIMHIGHTKMNLLKENGNY